MLHFRTNTVAGKECEASGEELARGWEKREIAMEALRRRASSVAFEEYYLKHYMRGTLATWCAERRAEEDERLVRVNTSASLNSSVHADTIPRKEFCSMFAAKGVSHEQAAAALPRLGSLRLEPGTGVRTRRNRR